MVKLYAWQPNGHGEYVPPETDLSDLLCCPFCGKQPETYWDNSIGEEYYREGFNIKCCHVHVYAIYKEEAIEKWNRRAT